VWALGRSFEQLQAVSQLYEVVFGQAIFAAGDDALCTAK
jgi:hypothetical protein